MLYIGLQLAKKLPLQECIIVGAMHLWEVVASFCEEDSGI